MKAFDAVVKTDEQLGKIKKKLDLSLLTVKGVLTALYIFNFIVCVNSVSGFMVALLVPLTFLYFIFSYGIYETFSEKLNRYYLGFDRYDSLMTVKEYCIKENNTYYISRLRFFDDTPECVEYLKSVNAVREFRLGDMFYVKQLQQKIDEEIKAKKDLEELEGYLQEAKIKFK